MVLSSSADEGLKLGLGIGCPIIFIGGIFLIAKLAKGIARSRRERRAAIFGRTLDGGNCARSYAILLRRWSRCCICGSRWGAHPAERCDAHLSARLQPTSSPYRSSYSRQILIAGSTGVADL